MSDRVLKADQNLSDVDTRQTALDNLSGAVTNNAVLAGDGTHVTLRTLATNDLPSTAVTPGTYGDATHVGQFTVDAKGRLTFAANVSITAGTGDLSKNVQNAGVTTFTSLQSSTTAPTWRMEEIKAFAVGDTVGGFTFDGADTTGHLHTNSLGGMHAYAREALDATHGGMSVALSATPVTSITRADVLRVDHSDNPWTGVVTAGALPRVTILPNSFTLSGQPFSTAANLVSAGSTGVALQVLDGDLTLNFANASTGNALMNLGGRIIAKQSMGAAGAVGWQFNTQVKNDPGTAANIKPFLSWVIANLHIADTQNISMSGDGFDFSSQLLLSCQVSSTVAAGSNGVNVSTFAGAGTLNVASSTVFTSTGQVFVRLAQNAWAYINYTGKGTGTLTGCTTVTSSGYGLTSAVLATGMEVSQTGTGSSSQAALNASSTTWTQLRAALGNVAAGGTLGTRIGVGVEDGSVGGTINNDIGVNVPSITAGGTRNIGLLAGHTLTTANGAVSRTPNSGDGHTTSGGYLITAASGNFSAADIGMRISGTGLAANTIIVQFLSATSVRIGTAATSTQTTTTFTIDLPTGSRTTHVTGSNFFSGMTTYGSMVRWGADVNLPYNATVDASTAIPTAYSTFVIATTSGDVTLPTPSIVAPSAFAPGTQLIVMNGNTSGSITFTEDSTVSLLGLGTVVLLPGNILRFRSNGTTWYLESSSGSSSVSNVLFTDSTPVTASGTSVGTVMRVYNSAAGGPSHLVQHSRGTAGTPVSVNLNDVLGNISFGGLQTGTTFANSATVRGVADGAGWDSTHRGGRLEFLTAATNSNQAVVGLFDKDGIFYVGTNSGASVTLNPIGTGTFAGEVSAGILASGTWQTATATPQTKANNTLATITGLSFPNLALGTKYRIRGRLTFDNNTVPSGFKIALTAASGLVASPISLVTVLTDMSNQTIQTMILQNAFGTYVSANLTGSHSYMFEFEGWFTVTTGGTLNVQFAQNTTNVATVQCSFGIVQLDISN